MKKGGETILKEEETKNITKFPPNEEEKSDMLEKCRIFSSFLIVLLVIRVENLKNLIKSIKMY